MLKQISYVLLKEVFFRPVEENYIFFKWNIYTICLWLCFSVKKAVIVKWKKNSEKMIRMCDQAWLDDPPTLLFGTMYACPEKSTRLPFQNRLGLKRNQGRLEASVAKKKTGWRLYKSLIQCNSISISIELKWMDSRLFYWILLAQTKDLSALYK